MQIRCTFCQTWIPISRDEMLAALQQMDQHDQVFYDAHCPKCRRSNRVEKRKIEILIPNWKKIIKEMQREAAAEVPEVKKTEVKEEKPKAKAVEKTQDTVKSTGKKTTAAEKEISAKRTAISPKKSPVTKGKTTNASKKVKAK